MEMGGDGVDKINELMNFLCQRNPYESFLWSLSFVLRFWLRAFIFFFLLSWQSKIDEVQCNFDIYSLFYACNVNYDDLGCIHFLLNKFGDIFKFFVEIL